MEQTPKYGLKKPGGSDYGDVSVLNENMEKIDTALGGLEDGKAPKSHTHTAAGVGADPAGSAAALAAAKQDATTKANKAEQNAKDASEKAGATAAHNANATAHMDIRNALSSAQQLAQEAKSLAEGRSRAVSYAGYSSMVAAVNIMSKTAMRVGDNLLLEALGVPDLWVCRVESIAVVYTYTTDAALEAALEQGPVQMGYYKLTMLETDKVDLSGYVPTARTINGKPLTANITLTAGDIGLGKTLTFTGAVTGTYDGTADKTIHIPAGGTFDKVVRTQAEFEALIASPDWLGAVSVCFVGNGGVLKFTRSDGQGIKVPQTVKQIQGMSGAVIEVTNFAYDASANRAGLWYEVPTTEVDRWIDGVAVSCTGNGNSYGFHAFTNVVNCSGKGTGSINGYGFHACTNMTNCTGAGASNSDGYGFLACERLVNCTGSGTGNGYGFGFHLCTKLEHCTGTGAGIYGDGYGYSSCGQLSRCAGTGTSTNAKGYGFYNCEYIDLYLPGATASTTATFYNCAHIDGRGKRGCRFVVGTSAAGWTVSDCDYLCDGTNDQVEINAAIQALPATGGEVVILDGTYNITASILVNRANTKLSGNGAATVLKRMWDSAYTFPASGGVVYITVDDCEIRNLKIDGNKTAYTSTYNTGICVASNYNVMARNELISNRNGIEIAYNFKHNAVIENTSRNNIIGLSVSGSFCSIVGNDCSGNKTGIAISSGAHNTISANVSSNSTGASGYGIQVSGNFNSISENICYGNNTGIFINGSSCGNVIVGNVCIRGTGLSADYTSAQYTIRLYDTSTNNLIADNMIMGKNYTSEGGTGNTFVNNKYN